MAIPAIKMNIGEHNFEPEGKGWQSTEIIFILIRSPDNLSWLLSTLGSSGSTQSSIWMFKLLTLSLRLSSATLQGTLMSAACMCVFVLSVTTHDS